MSSKDGSFTAGRAAHITAAAKNGPRHDDTLTPEQRSGFDNGIWMCTAHAEIVDSDEVNYSVKTLKQWRELAERKVYREIVGRSGDAWDEPSTLVSLGLDIVVRAVWIGGDRDEWRFRVKQFVSGDEASLRAFIEESPGTKTGSNFVAVESQGDGRLLSGMSRWERAPEGGDGELVITLPIEPRVGRTDPKAIKDFGLDESGDFRIAHGDFVIVEGVEARKQQLANALGMARGEWFLDPELGSQWGRFAKEFGADRDLLGRLFCLDAARLVNIPSPSPRHHGRGQRAETPSVSLGFVERVESVEVLDLDWDRHETKVRIALRWALSHEPWAGELTVSLGG
ncbi:hypothetical protein JYJ95_06670 [Corallococcus exiguus]|uniref:hypothetical protein n=1 Tax=Corallococcus exiguus TaxID=83462 RepID=UPI001A8F7D4A|nr:hypothetical protein [Corallococcus exiguus]MBN8466188.1 hypothetical protein [Corallococcus exiguus]